MKLNKQSLIRILNGIAWTLALIFLFYLIKGISVTTDPITWTELISLIQVLIWPLTCLIIILLFKTKLSGIIASLGSLKASKDGIEMTFQNKIESVQQMLSGGPVGALSKSGKKINISGSKQSPSDQLKEINEALNEAINSKASEYNIDVSNLGATEISSKLKDIGAITLQKARMFNALIDLTESGNPSISQSQVNQVKTLFLSLQL